MKCPAPVFVPVLLLVLTACGSRLPDSNPIAGPVDYGSGVGFGDYRSYESERLAREQALRSGGTGPSPVASVPVAAVPQTTGGAAPVISADELRAAGLPSGGGGLPSAAPVQSAPVAGSGTGIAAQTPQPIAPARESNSGISDEQSFAAVSARETIESDAERLARQRASYQQVQPEALPQRSGAARPNIVQYALTTENQLGQSRYRRGGFFQERRFRAACAEYPSSDLAQEAFLAQGGPERDRLGVDPDGDGFACAWDPAPYRAAQG